MGATADKLSHLWEVKRVPRNPQITTELISDR